MSSMSWLLPLSPESCLIISFALSVKQRNKLTTYVVNNYAMTLNKHVDDSSRPTYIKCVVQCNTK